MHRNTCNTFLLDAAGLDVVLRDQAFLTHWLCVLKILHRKAPNRRAFGQKGVAALTKVLNLSAGHDVAREACNVTLNMCYDPMNVTAFLDSGEVRESWRNVSECCYYSLHTVLYIGIDFDFTVVCFSLL